MVDFWLVVLRKAFWASINSIGQSEGTLAFAVIVLLVGAFWILRKEGWQAMRRHVASTIAKAISVPIIAWLPFFLFELLTMPYLRLTEEQLRADNATKLVKEKDKTIGDQKKTIQDLEAKVNERPKVVYSDSKRPPQPSKSVEPTKINNLLVDARVMCTLRDPLKLPNNISVAYFNDKEITSFLEGPMGKAALRPITDVRYRRMEEEGKASTVLRYDLPNNSDLIGEPISSLSRYDSMVINLWAINYNAFTECGFVEVTLRVNGIDVIRNSFTARLVLNEPDKTKWVKIALKEMKLPQ